MKYLVFLAIFFGVAFAELQPTKTEGVVMAMVTDFENKPLIEETITFIGQSTGAKYQGVTNEKGEFSILCGGGEAFKVYYESLVGPYQVGEFDFPKPPYKGNVNVQFENKTITLRDVLFDSGKASLKASSFVELKKLLKGLQSNQEIKVEIAGHTDDVGEEEVNQKLSEARANTVKDYLVSKGVDPTRLVANGYGESQPVESNATAKGKAANRRTEVRILE